MQQRYRGHLIRMTHGPVWQAELIELATGALLPTSVMASTSEGVEVCVRRARALVDLYLDAQGGMRGATDKPPLRLVEPIRL